MMNLAVVEEALGTGPLYQSVRVSADRFDEGVRSVNIEVARLAAMEIAEKLLVEHAEATRQFVYKNVFRHRIFNGLFSYQKYDFEVADYGEHAIFPQRRFFRGPRLSENDLATGMFFTIFGAAQMFGRGHVVGPHQIIRDRLGVPCVNFSMPGAGPEHFLNEDFLRFANAGRAVVVQILSGRSIGCDEYPGTQWTIYQGEKTERLRMLRRIWARSPDEAVRLVGKWQRNYIAMMKQLISQIRVPIVLAWLSERAPSEWSIDQVRTSREFGRFPQLVDRNMVDALKADCSEIVEVVRDPGLPDGYVSRFTGQKCPRFDRWGELVWENNYYPSATAIEEVSMKISEALRAI
jgi:hypothetical protein